MHWTYVISGLVFALAIFGFAITCFVERESRAGILALITTLVFAAVWLTLGLIFPAFRSHLSLAAWAMVLGTAVLLALPIGSSEPLKIDESKTERFDERHIMFGRNELKKGSPQYEAYYTKLNPSMKDTDDHIRSMPELGDPGGTYYHEYDSQYMCALFETIEKIRHLADPGEPVGEPAPMRPDEATRRIKGFGKHLGAVGVRTTRLKDYHVYSRRGRHLHNWGEANPIEHTHAVAIAVEMDHTMVHSAPLATTSTETAVEYLSDAMIAINIATFIKNLGYRARAHIDGNYQVFATAVSHDAGLGELGRLGLLITPSYGPRVRTAVVTTDMPLLDEKPINIGVQHFCEICKKCATNCPSQSIATGEKHEVRGVMKWQSRMESCFQYWKKVGTDCGICLAVCPYSKPNTFYHKILRFFVKRNAIARILANFGDDLFYGKKPRHFYKPQWFSQE